ncbi:MAG: CobD/CbiB family protein [Sideroxyarcus sp.]|nr:CobD/CbiB family protein [Sideroxyarcus sp.]
MSLLALIAALLLEQVVPLSSRQFLYHWPAAYVDFFRQHLDAGQHTHGRIAWLLAVLPLLALLWLLYAVLLAEHAVFAWAFSLLVLYLCMGFRQFSHYFTDIHQALRDNDLLLARQLLGEWTGKSCSDLNPEEVARLTIEQALLASHRHVFGVVFWFVICMMLGMGPLGAVLYRLATFMASHWRGEDEEANAFVTFAEQACRVLEWLPLRLTASSFAIVGNFEDTIYCWRTQAAEWPEPDEGIILASGAGALGIKLGQTLVLDDQPVYRTELGSGDAVDIDHMQSAVGLVWRTLVFQLILLLLLTVANLLG